MTARKKAVAPKPRKAAKARATKDRLPSAIAPASKALVRALAKKHSRALVLSSFDEFIGPQTHEAGRAASSAVAEAAALCRKVNSVSKLSRAASLIDADRRDPMIKKMRAQLLAAGSVVLVQLYRELFARGDVGDVLRLAQRRQQPTNLFLPIDTPRPAIDIAISAISDLLAQTRDPCRPCMKSKRQLDIFRRPYDAMPLFFPNAHFRADGTFFPDVDRLVWEWLPLTLFTLTSVDGEQYEEATPATDAAGNVPARLFFLWRGMALSTAYKHGERKELVDGQREIKKHPSVPGLHVVDHHLFVHIPTYLVERVERKTTHWSKEAAGLSRTVIKTTGRPTRTEKFLLRLESEGANAPLLREEWAEQIAEERRLGIYD
jgi:hypothetical protein